jgi:acyl-CoA thioester hydrolase
MNDASPARRFRVHDYVRWSDVDASGIIRWTTYPRFVELAETELFRNVGFPYDSVWRTLSIWLPRVQLHFDYRTPALLDEKLEIEIWIGRLGRSSIRFEFALKRPDGKLAAEGHMIAVAIDRESGRPVSIPTPLATALAPYESGEAERG